MLHVPKTDMINIGYYCYPIQSLGPGNRFVLWTQGCNRSCYRCASPNLQSLAGGEFYSVDALIKLMQKSNCRGLTISGGEPLLQAQPILSLLQKVRIVLPEWDIILFTGFLLEEIELDVRPQLVRLVDLLVDGPYVDSLNNGIGLRGSSNQNFHFFSQRLYSSSHEITSCPHPKRQLILLSDEEMLAVGIASPQSTEN